MLGTTTLIKLMVLLMLEGADYPVATSTLYDFFLGNNGYTGYFSLNETISTLNTDGYVESTKSFGATFLIITDKGRETLDQFQNRVSKGIKDDIKTFLEKNGMTIVNKAALLANIYRVSAGDYVAELTAKEKYNDLFSMRINVPTEESAHIICDNWRNAASDIYSYILNRLLKGEE